MHDKILDFLRKKQEYVSGEDISAGLKISRQGLWKHIQQLKDSGYEIVAVPHLGYKLVSSPDRLFPSEIASGLQTKITGKKIYYFDSISSTMDMAQQLANKGAPEGTLVLAEAQTKGRGRLGRLWSSPKYKGIYLSLILRPAVSPAQTPMLTLMAAVSVAEAIRECCGLEPRIKWPNDILIHDKKIGGILTELNAEMDVARFVIIGVGLNANNDRHALVAGATSLKEETQAPVNRVRLLQEFLRKLESNYLVLHRQGPAAVAQKWRALALTLGKRVKVVSQKTHMEGVAFDIDSDGALLIRNDSGLVQKMTAGDLVHCR